MSQFFMYVLLCKDQTFYTGYTVDLEKRIATHNAGKGAKYTRMRTPVTLLYAKEFTTKQEAMKAEAAFKKFSRPKKEIFLQTIGASITRPVIIYLEGDKTDETKELSD